MPENEKYVPLEKSSFWQDATASAEELGGETFPTKLHRLERLFFVSGTGDTWDGGRLVNIYKPGVKIKGDSPPHRASEAVLQEDPEENPLFKLIPGISAEEFMKELSDDPSLKLMADRVKYNRPIYPIDERGASVCRIPRNADIHYLSALMMMCKHILQHPDRLDKGGEDRQLGFLRGALNTGFDIISQGDGVGDNFAKSCAELQKKIPFLTAFSKEYVRERDEDYHRELELRKDLSLMDNAQLRRFLEVLQPSAPTKAGPSGPRKGL